MCLRLIKYKRMYEDTTTRRQSTSIVWVVHYFALTWCCAWNSNTRMRLAYSSCVYGMVSQRRGQHTVTFSKSASEEVGDRGLMGLREGELPTLETYSGSGTYRTCKHNTRLCLHRLCLRANMHAHHTCICCICTLTQPNYMFDKANEMRPCK